MYKGHKLIKHKANIFPEGIMSGGIFPEV